MKTESIALLQLDKALQAQLDLMIEIAGVSSDESKGILKSVQAALFVRDSYVAGLVNQLFPGSSHETHLALLEQELQSALEKHRIS